MIDRLWVLPVIVISIFSILGLSRPGHCESSTQRKVIKEKPHQDSQQNEGMPEDTPRRSIQMNEIQIRGEVEKPKAMFIIPHTPTDYTFLRGSKKDFSKEILAPITIEWVEDMAKYPESLR